MKTSKVQIETIEKWNKLDNGFTAFPDEIFYEPAIKFHSRIDDRVLASFGVREDSTVKGCLKMGKMITLLHIACYGGVDSDWNPEFKEELMNSLTKKQRKEIKEMRKEFVN